MSAPAHAHYYEKPSESSPKDNDVQDSEDVADKEGQHQMTEDEQSAFEEEKEEDCHLKEVRSGPDCALIKFVLRANAGESSFVYLGGKIPIDASTFPNADLPIDPNMPDLEDDSDAFSNDGIFNGAMMLRMIRGNQRRAYVHQPPGMRDPVIQTKSIRREGSLEFKVVRVDTIKVHQNEDLKYRCLDTSSGYKMFTLKKNMKLNKFINHV
ncbi:hypothetical protein Tco_1475405 [Tanacetum coccineum]